MKVLYIFPSSRKAPSADVPSTQMYGLDRLPAYGIMPDAAGRDDALPSWLKEGPLRNLVGFKLRHALLFFRARSYDVVFGPALLYLMPLKKFFGGKARYVALNIELVRILRRNAAHPLRLRFIESLMKEFSAIVCLATAQKDWLVARYPSLEGRVFVVPLAADTAFFEPMYEGRESFVLSVGADDGRDYRTLISAAERMPDTQFEIVCSPRNLAGMSRVPANVHVYYDLPFSELERKYQTARMIVIPTHSDESAIGADCSGQTVLLDAMASGLPVIATRKAYLTDYVRGEQDALIVDCYNPEQLVEALRRLDADSSLRTTLAKNARIRAEKHLSADKMAEELSRIFKEIAN